MPKLLENGIIIYTSVQEDEKCTSLFQCISTST